MALDILLVHPGKVRHDYLSEHLGIASLKAYVSSRGYSADTLDLAVEYLSIGDGIRLVLTADPRVVGVSLLADTRFRGLEFIRKLREAGYSGHIIVGGYFATFASQEILRDFPEVDFVVRGEGELTLTELLDYLLKNSGKSLPEIQGISFRKNGMIVETDSRPLIEDLDHLPPPDRKYARAVLDRGARLRISGTRGCWGQCTFCDIIGLYGSSSGKAWRARSVRHLVDEIESLVNTYGIRYLVFNDDQFLLRGNRGLERAAEFAEELQRRHLTVQFELMCRADTVTRQTMKVLKSAGLQRVFLGLESFDERQLKRFRKRISVRQNLKAVITLYQLRIDVVASVIMADADTSLWDMVKQFILLFELRRRYFNSDNCQISINQKIDLYPGTAIYRDYRERGLLTRDDYLEGYAYRLKPGTRIRLKLFDLETHISRLIFRPWETLKTMLSSARWAMGHLVSTSNLK